MAQQKTSDKRIILKKLYISIKSFIYHMSQGKNMLCAASDMYLCSDFTWKLIVFFKVRISLNKSDGILFCSFHFEKMRKKVIDIAFSFVVYIKKQILV